MSKSTMTKSETEELHRRRIEYCKTSTKFILTNVILGGVMIVYTIVGALLFQKLETTNEKEQCYALKDRYQPVEDKTAKDLWSVASTFSAKDTKEDEMAAIQNLLKNFRRDALELKYTGTNCSMLGEDGGDSFQFSFSGALLFSVTVFTTVGYGNIAPKTFYGRLVSIVYAMIGIPMMLVFLANIGDIMADVFRFMYSKVCCCGCLSGRKSTGSSLTESKQNLNDTMQSDPKVTSESEELEEDDDDQLGVPLTITLTLIAGYLFMGSLLFGTWENWTMLQSAYYCFITISTIGFGDVVPGTNDMNSTSGQLTMIGAALYLTFGMAIMSMAFNLIQEEMVNKFVWVSEKLGLSKKTEEEALPPSAKCPQDPIQHHAPQPSYSTSNNPPNPLLRDSTSLTNWAAAAINQPMKNK